MPFLPPTRLTIFNHKGGVGKTTLTVNIAVALAALGKKVLLVDTDPQCNLTSYLLSDDVVDDLLDSSEKPNGATIWSAVRPLVAGENALHNVKPIEIQDVSLIPGDIRLSEFEEFLGERWTDCFRRRAGGFVATSSISDLVTQICRTTKFDYVFYDTGPNIGPLNRSLLMDADHFLVPVACDLFSVRALSTLGQTLKKWIIDCGTIASLAPDDAPLLSGKPHFLGYVPQKFKVYGQTMSSEASKYLRQIKKRVFEDITGQLRPIDDELVKGLASDPILGQIKDFSTLVQIAQREGTALWECKKGDADQKQQSKDAFHDLAKTIDKQVKAFDLPAHGGTKRDS